jgi:asparagine synthase (glutamine-hydrolysing)
MYGSYNLKNQSFICHNADAWADGNIELHFRGNLYLDKGGERRLLSKIVRDYPNLAILKHLQGYFALVFLNKKEKYLLLIRDQFGVMPLYYSIAGERIIFGTTITPILEKTNQNININQNVIHEYFMFRYVSGENTFFNNIHEVKPGSIVQIDSNGKITKQDYYQFKYSSSSTESKIPASSHFENEFWKSLKQQTFDKDKKKIGVLSSGGIDSSILVSCSSKILSPGFHTYYIANAGYEHNRTEDVNYLGRIYNTNHRNVFISGKEFAENLIETIRINEEPLNHPSSVLRNYLLKQLNGEVDVLLSGEGADCLCCGYYIFDIIKYIYFKKYLRSTGRLVAGLIPDHLIPKKYSNKYYKLTKAFFLPVSEYTILYADFNSNNRENIAQILSDDLPTDFGHNYFSLFLNENSSALDTVLRVYQTYYLTEGLNTITKLSNASHIEHRHPFIDINLVNQFNLFPWNEKIKFFKRKHQIVELGKKYLPKEFFNKRKEGFGVPLKYLFYEKTGLAPFMDLLVDKKTRERGVFNSNYLDNLLVLYKDRKMQDASFENILWPIINLELWFRIFIDRDISAYS